MARASTRISIRWPPAPAIEPTDTLVLSLGGYYLDLRVRTIDKSVDWLLAGERIIESQHPLKVKFTHVLDSRSTPGAPLPEPDVGDFQKLPNGDDLETGAMPNHDAGGQVMEYEEVWRELDWSAGVSADAVNWIIESVDHVPMGTKRFYAKLGRYFLAVGKTLAADDVTYVAVRQTFDSSRQEWKLDYDIGGATGGSGLSRYKDGMQGEKEWRTGQEVAFEGGKYIVRAAT